MKTNLKTFPSKCYHSSNLKIPLFVCDNALDCVKWKEDFEEELREMERANNNSGEFFSLKLQELIKEVLGE